jgi:N-acetylmuramoyl-L-alanine amidase
MFRSAVYFVLTCLPLTLPPSVRASGRPVHDVPSSTAHPAGWVPVKTLARDYGFDRVTDAEEQLTLQGPRSTLVLSKNGRRVELDGAVIWLNEPLKLVKGKWSFATVDVNKTLAPALRPPAFLAGQGHRIVVLDPGHGGKDSGAESPAGLLEKTVALDIAKRTRKHLEEAGCKVYLTREDDSFLELTERVKLAKTWKADLFVSIHLNAISRFDAAGVETFVLSLPGHSSTNDPEGHVPSQISHPGNQQDAANQALAFSLHKSLISGNDVEDRGLRRARFLVLRQSETPAALVECGFLSNPREAGRLSVAYYREKMALSLAQGIDKYLSEVKKAVLAAEAQSTSETVTP